MEPSRKDQGIDPLDGHLRFEQSRVAQARRAAVNGDRGDGGSFENQRRDAGGDPRVIRMANAKAGNVGDEIFQSCRTATERLCFRVSKFPPARSTLQTSRFSSLVVAFGGLFPPQDQPFPWLSRRAVAVDHLMRDLAALREKPADDCLRVWGAQMVGSFVIVKAPVIAAGEPLLPRRGLGLGFQKRLHLRAPVAGGLAAQRSSR